MRLYRFSGDNPMRHYLIGIDEAYDWIAAKNLMDVSFGGGQELKDPIALPVLGVIRPSGQWGPIFRAASDDEELRSSPTVADLLKRRETAPR